MVSAPVAVSWEAPHGSRLLIVGGLPLQRRRQVVREIVQLLRRQLGQRTERVDLSLERQLADVHEPVAVVVLPMDAQRRTNAIAERSGVSASCFGKISIPSSENPDP